MRYSGKQRLITLLPGETLKFNREAIIKKIYIHVPVKDDIVIPDETTVNVNGKTVIKVTPHKPENKIYCVNNMVNMVMHYTLKDAIHIPEDSVVETKGNYEITVEIEDITEKFTYNGNRSVVDVFIATPVASSGSNNYMFFDDDNDIITVFLNRIVNNRYTIKKLKHNRIINMYDVNKSGLPLTRYGFVYTTVDKRNISNRFYEGSSKNDIPSYEIEYEDDIMLNDSVMMFDIDNKLRRCFVSVGTEMAYLYLKPAYIIAETDYMEVK